MLGAAVAFLLCLLPSQVNGLITSDAKCLIGYDWMFSSINQSPCDVSEELMSVCYGSYPLTPLTPLPVGYTYSGPWRGYGNSCSCSSVVYSLLSACAICQNHSYNWWSYYSTNCTTVFIGEYKPQLPDGVRVPAYAYQDVSSSDAFNVTLAQRMRSPDSTRLPSSSTASSFSFSSSSYSVNAPPIVGTSSSVASSSGDGHSVNNTPAIIGGVVGGVVALGLVAALIIFLLRPKKQNYDSNSPQSPNMGYTSKTTPSSTTFPPGSPNKSADGQNPYPSVDPSIYDPYRQQFPPLEQNATPGFTENSAHNSLPPQNLPQNTDTRGHYSGIAEV